MVGVLSGSVSILSEAIHSAIDLLAALIAFLSVRVADRPPDDEHTYGHGKAESISGAVEAALILIAAFWIVVEAVRKLVGGGEVAHVHLGTAVMGVSAVVNATIARYLHRVAEREDSLALAADAQHLTADVYTSAGVGLGLGVVWITGWHWLDPVAALGVAILIGVIGVKLTRQAMRHLMDSSLPPEEISTIETILRAEPRLLSWHRLRTRKSGSERHVDMHIVLGGETLLEEAHAISVELERRITSALPNAQVVIHIDPHTNED